MMKTTFAVLCAATALVAVAPASAATLTSGSGWQSDTLTASGQPTASSPWSFTVSQASTVSVTDDFVTGDIYTLSGGLTGVTTFYAGDNDVRATGPGGAAWLSASYSKIAIDVGPGSYSFSITGLGQGGIPAGLWVRLDPKIGAVPEAATWMMMIFGFGMAGAAMRYNRRSTKVTFA